MLERLTILGAIWLACTPSAGSSIPFDVTDLAISVPHGISKSITVTSSASLTALTASTEWATSEITVAEDGSSSTTVTVDASELEPGDYAATLKAQAKGFADTTLPLSVTVTEQESVVPSETSLDLTVPQGAVRAVVVTATVATGNPTVTATTVGGWLSATVTSATTPATIELSVDTAGMAQGAHVGTVTLAASGYKSVAVPVNLTIGKPALAFSPDAVARSVDASDVDSFTITLDATLGSSAFTLSTSPASIASVTADTAATPATVTVELQLSSVLSSAPQPVTVTATPTNAAIYDGGTATVTVDPYNKPRLLVAHFHDDSRLDIGTLGLAHGERIPSGSGLTLATVCSGAGPYTSCTLTGPVSNNVAKPASYNNRRCLNDTSTICTDADDCPGSSCVYFVAPPIPLRGGPACVVAYYEGSDEPESITGTTNLVTGQTALDPIPIRALVHTAQSNGRACPTCEQGAGGAYACVGGERNFLPCTPHGASGTFTLGDVSLDCPPLTTANVAGEGLPVTLTSLQAAQAEDPAIWRMDDVATPLSCEFGFSTCMCGSCANNSKLGCRSDADCTTVGGSCTVGTSARPSGCDSNAMCDAVGDFGGECSDTQISYCSNAVWARCQVDGDCDDAITQAAANGVCDVVEQRPCFYSIGQGTPTSELKVRRAVVSSSETWFGSNACVGETSNGALNTIVGLPGPARINLRITPETVQ